MKLRYLPEVERIEIIPYNNLELRGIKNQLTRKPEGQMFLPQVKMKLSDGSETQYKKDDNTVPLGLQQEVFTCCKEFGYNIDFLNKNEFPIQRGIKLEDFSLQCHDFFKDYTIDGNDFILRDYQIRVAFNIIKNRYCNISVATSGGKTLIYSLVIFYLLNNLGKGKKFLLVVPSKTLVTQFYDDIINFCQDKVYLNIKEIFGEEEKPRTRFINEEPNLYIGTFQSLADKDKYPKKYFKQFQSVTTDEGHRTKSNSYKKILKSTFNNAYYRQGMSGSFYKNDSCEMMNIMALTGPVVDTVKAKELMDKGFISKVKIKSVLLYHNDYDFTENLKIVASRDKKSAYDLEVAKIQESDERLEIINKIVKQCKQNTLVLFHNREYGQKILEYLKEHNEDKDFFYIDGSVKNNGNSKNIINNRTYIKKEMEKTNRVKVLVASFNTLSTGVSIKAICNIIFCQSFKKEQVIIQSIGRALRLHLEKYMAYIFDIVDIFNEEIEPKFKSKKFHNILYNHWLKRVSIYDEEEYPNSNVEFQLQIK